MRILSAVVLAAIVSTPALAATITHSPALSGRAEAFWVAPVSEYGCSNNLPGPYASPGYAGDYYGGVGSPVDTRAVYEFDLSGITQINKARFTFLAEQQDYTTTSLSCVAASQGDGQITDGDYFIEHDDVFGLYYMDADHEAGIPLSFFGDYDITQLLKGLMAGGAEHIRFVFAITDASDVEITLSDVRLILDVPEPATLALFGLGLAGLAVRRRKQ